MQMVNKTTVLAMVSVTLPITIPTRNGNPLPVTLLFTAAPNPNPKPIANPNGSPNSDPNANAKTYVQPHFHARRRTRCIW